MSMTLCLVMPLGSGVQVVKTDVLDMFFPWHAQLSPVARFNGVFSLLDRSMREGGKAG